jgi:hypothetical protein
MRELPLNDAVCLDCGWDWRSYSVDRLEDYAAFHEAHHPTHLVHIFYRN